MEFVAKGPPVTRGFSFHGCLGPAAGQQDVMRMCGITQVPPRGSGWSLSLVGGCTLVSSGFAPTQRHAVMQIDVDCRMGWNSIVARLSSIMHLVLVKCGGNSYNTCNQALGHSSPAAKATPASSRDQALRYEERLSFRSCRNKRERAPRHGFMPLAHRYAAAGRGDGGLQRDGAGVWADGQRQDLHHVRPRRGHRRRWLCW